MFISVTVLSAMLITYVLHVSISNHAQQRNSKNLPPTVTCIATVDSSNQHLNTQLFPFIVTISSDFTPQFSHVFVGFFYLQHVKLIMSNNNNNNASALNFLSEVGRWLSSVSGDSRETSFLFQRLSVIVQRFNSVIIFDSFCTTDEDPDL